ncbi:MAG: GMC oxidoreductase [Methylococcales bacterium]
MNIVVGSGPAGVACASALLDRGLPVLMLDAALDLEVEAARHVKALASTACSSWPEESVSVLTSRRRAISGDVPLKYVFGSDYPYRVPTGAVDIAQHGARALRSYAVGGLSQAWGATILPYADDDIADWPVRSAELNPHYEAAMRLMPLSAEDDDLSRVFPLFTTARASLAPSRQAEQLLNTLARHRDELRQRGITFGRARLAIHASGTDRGCRLCGFCLNGCPYGAIYSAAHTLKQLLRRSGFIYRPGVVVQQVTEHTDRVVIVLVDLAAGRSEVIEGCRVFLGCGFLNTTALVMDALSPCAEPVRLPSSQAFLVPFWMDTSVRDVAAEAQHTLSQVYLHLDRREVTSRRVQLQFYTYNDLLPLVLDKPLLKSLWRLIPSMKSRVIDRLIVVQGFLHSSDSDPLELTRSEHGRFMLRGQISARTRATVKRVVRTLFRERSSIGGTVLLPLLTFSQPGQSFHNAGGFPMAADTKPGQSDLLGRPNGLRRVHIIDAAAFPSVPATTITLTVMANAHRIGSLADG